MRECSVVMLYLLTEVKFTPMQTKKTYTRGIAPDILNLGNGGICRFIPEERAPKRLTGRQSRSGRSGEHRNPSAVHRPAYSLA
jgi:hypothetical protein